MHTLVHEQDIRDEGIAIGIERGIEQGIEQENIATIKRLIQKNYPDNEIMEIAACSQELIDKVRSESKKQMPRT